MAKNVTGVLEPGEGGVVKLYSLLTPYACLTKACQLGKTLTCGPDMMKGVPKNSGA